jgi:hypothetical protein
MNEKKILILSITNQNCAPRVIRQIDALKNNYDLYCCGLDNSIIPKEKFFRIQKGSNSFFQKIIISLLKLFRLYDLAEKFIVKFKYKIDIPKQCPEFDLIIAHDLDAVALAYTKFNGGKVFVDLHEYAQEEFGETFYWKFINKGFLNYQCKKYFPKVDASSTVCQSISDEYKKSFTIAPVVITNAAPFYDLEPSHSDDRIRMINHGGAIRSRKIELMIEIVKKLDNRFSLDLMLVPNDLPYYNLLKTMAEETENVKIIPPVEYNDIVTFCNQYDLGLYIIFPTNLNNKYSLPNKFFEFIQSRLAIVTGPSVEMKNYIDRYNLGVAANSFEPDEIADKINNLTNEQIEEFKSNSHKHARELSSETNDILLNKIVTDLLNNNN